MAAPTSPTARTSGGKNTPPPNQLPERWGPGSPGNVTVAGPMTGTSGKKP